MNKKERDGMSFIIRHVMGRCHVGLSYRSAIKYLISRLEKGYKTFEQQSKERRRFILEATVKHHQENRELYNFVNRGCK